MENPFEKLEEEHRAIEQELLEIEEIANNGEINYPNFIHTFKKLREVWDKHELKEEKIFPILKKEKIIMPVKTMLLEHGELKKHKEAVTQAISSGSEPVLKQALLTHGKIIIQKLREHINKEDEVLYTMAMEELTPKEIEDIEKILDES